MSRERWNSSLHAVDTLMGAIPDGARRGVDVDGPSIEHARSHDAATRTRSLDALPGARFRRLPCFRYGLTWGPDGARP